MELDILSYKRDIAPTFLCIYGGEKTGKTTTLASLLHEEVDGQILEPESRMHIVDVDHGLEGFINRWVSKGKPITKDGNTISIPQVDIEVVNNLQEFHEAVWVLPEGYRYYVIDSFTRAGKFFIKKVQPKQEPGYRHRNANMDISYLFEDYIDRFEELNWQLQKNDAWLIIICHERRKDAWGDSDERIEPLLFGAAGQKLDRVVTGIWRLQLVTKETPSGWVTGRQFRTAQTSTIIAGDRTGALDEVEPANIARCIRKIEKFRALNPTKETQNGK